MRTILLVISLTFLSGGTQEVKTQEAKAAEIPKVIEAAIPGYPRLPTGAREEGEIEVTLEIDKDGTVLGATATTGPVRLRSWAEAAARQWRFEPLGTGTHKSVVVFAFVLERGLADPPAITATFKTPNRVEVVAERRDVVIIADPPVENVEKQKKRQKRGDQGDQGQRPQLPN